MGRPSKLTDAQWAEIGKRLLTGESTSDLAREFGISKTRVSARFSKRTEKIQNVAVMAANAEIALEQLPDFDRKLARGLIDDLKDISLHMAGAARFGASTAHRVSGIANSLIDRIEDADPLSAESLEALKGIALLTDMANKSSHIGLNLLAANKEGLKLAVADMPNLPVFDPKKLSTGALEELLLSRVAR